MTRLHSALLALIAILAVGCGTAENAEPRAATGPATEAQKGGAGTTASSVPAGSTEPNAPAQAAATLEFQKRIQAYMKVHNEAEGKVPNLKKTDDPQEIADREKALAQMIMTLRAGAQPNEIFAPEYQPYFIQIVQDDFKTRKAVDRKAIIDELPAKMKVDVNTVYPTNIPLATFPPMLLRKLPDLPPELEYRIVGRSLILRDVKANLIVDILRDVVPTIPS
jgi:hypothetical protein